MQMDGNDDADDDDEPEETSFILIYAGHILITKPSLH